MANIRVKARLEKMATDIERIVDYMQNYGGLPSDPHDRVAIRYRAREIMHAAEAIVAMALKASIAQHNRPNPPRRRRTTRK